MLPEAFIVHRHANRVRLRIPSQKGDAAFFTRVERALSALDHISYAHANPLTGSVLLYYEGDFDIIARYAEAEQFFTLTPIISTARNPVQNIAAKRLDQSDQFIRHMTNDTFDLYEVMFVTLLGASIVQALRGRVLGPASTLLSHAAAILAIHRARIRR